MILSSAIPTVFSTDVVKEDVTHYLHTRQTIITYTFALPNSLSPCTSEKADLENLLNEFLSICGEIRHPQLLESFDLYHLVRIKSPPNLVQSPLVVYVNVNKLITSLILNSPLLMDLLTILPTPTLYPLYLPINNNLHVLHQSHEDLVKLLEFRSTPVT